MIEVASTKIMLTHPFTPADYRALRTRIEQLVSGIRDLGKEARDACSGSETFHDNPGFDMAQGEKHALTELLVQLRIAYDHAQIIDPCPTPGGPINFGSVFELLDVSVDADENAPANWYRIGSYWIPQPEKPPEGEFEDDPIVLSYGSPFAQSVLGKNTNDEFEVRVGEQVKHFLILEIS